MNFLRSLSREEAVAALKASIRDVPDFPKPGIVFKDVTTLLRDGALLRLCADQLVELCAGRTIDKVVAVESRGFIFGAMVAERIGAGFVPVRKPGKLPALTYSASYALEYGSDAVHMHRDALERGDSVLVVDDVIATGGTAAATVELVETAGGVVNACLFLVELTFLHGRERLPGRDVQSLISF
jgi:adenine phosphoribosyltransferase